MVTWGRQLSELDEILRDRRSSHRQNNSSSASPQTHNTDNTHTDWHTYDTAVVTGLNSKIWQLPTNIRDRARKTTTHLKLVCQSVIFLKLSVQIMHTIRQAPRLLTFCLTWQILHLMGLQLHTDTLVWQAVTCSNIHSFGPLHVLVITPCFCNEIVLFTIKTVNHTAVHANSLLLLFDKWMGSWEKINSAAVIVRIYIKQEWKLSTYVLYQNHYTHEYKLLLCIIKLYLFLYPLIYPVFPFISSTLCFSEVLTVKKGCEVNVNES